MNLVQIARHYRTNPYFTREEFPALIRQYMRERAASGNAQHRSRTGPRRHNSAGREGSVIIATARRLARMTREQREPHSAEIQTICDRANALATYAPSGLTMIVRGELDRITRRCNRCNRAHAGIGPDQADRSYCPRCRAEANRGRSRAAQEPANIRFCAEYMGQLHPIPRGDLTLPAIAEILRGNADHTPRDFEMHEDQIMRIGPDRGRLRNYSYRTGAYGPHVDRSAANVGIELEVAFETKAQQRGFCRDLHGQFQDHICCAKSDGSILSNVSSRDVDRAGHGFSGQAEIVTGYGPREETEDVLNRAMAIAKRHGAKCPSSTGLHIAIGRGPMSESTIAKLIVFWSRPENFRDLLKFQRRDPNTYCRLAEDETRAAIQNPDRLCKSTDWIYQMQAGRYAIVSPANHTHLEFRGFGGSMTPTLNLARIALVVELVEYCRTTAQTLDDLLIAPFLTWLGTHETKTAARALKRFKARAPGRERLKGYRYDPTRIPEPLPALVAAASAPQGEPLTMPDDEDETDPDNWPEDFNDDDPDYGEGGG